MSPQRQIALELLEKFPKAGSQTLSKIAIRDNPSVFASLDTARQMFRALRGAHGNKQRSLAPVEHARGPQSAKNPFGKIPEGKTHFETWGAVQINGPVKVLVLSDIHIPFHSRDALLAALKYGRDRRPDVVLLNGDTSDIHTLSKFQKDPRKKDFPGEIKTCGELLGIIRGGFPKARIIFKLGNHDERYEAYMFCKAPELLGIPDFEMRSLLKFDNHGVEEVRDMRPIRIGDLNVLHGHEYRFAVSNPVNAARGLFLRCKAYAMCGHFHQKSEHSEKTVEDKNIATWSTGCLCDMHPDYAPLNNWGHGFAFVEASKDSNFQVENKKISKDWKIY